MTQHPSSSIQKTLAWFLAILAFSLIQATCIDQLNPYYLSILNYAGINIILAVSLNLVNGFTGQFSMGHAGFMSVGGYVSAFLTTHYLVQNSEGIPQIFFLGQFFLALLVGGIAAGAVGYCVGLPSLRLKGDYLAIVTLGFGEMIRVIILNLDAVGGARGLPNIPGYSNFGWVYFWVVFCVFVIWRLVHSSYGRACVAVREDEIAAEAMGVNTTQVKVRAFAIGAFFAGVAGGLFAHTLQYLTPQTFDFNRSFEIIIMVVLGGMGSITGSIVAALFLTSLRELLRPLQEWTQIDFRMVIYSLMLILMMLLRPQGLLGTRELLQILPVQLRKRERTQTGVQQ